MDDLFKQALSVVNDSSNILIIQADNPDADSLGSAIALEYILSGISKSVDVYCGVDIPGYLRYQDGWDRVSSDITKDYDLAIFVDVSTYTLLDKMIAAHYLDKIKKIKSIVFDHHEIVNNSLDFQTVTLNDINSSSTGELIYKFAINSNLEIPLEAKTAILNSILGDTQGLSNKLAKPSTYRLVADLIEQGVDRAALEEKRREYSRMSESVFKFKAALIDRVAFAYDDKIAYVSINQDEINKYSPLYNPAPLIQSDMLNVEAVKVAIVFKNYDNGRITGSIRSNQTAPIANKLAEHFSGGGHSFASGFRIDKTDKPGDIINECLAKANELLSAHETV